MPALVAHAEQQMAAKATANFVDHDALTITQALYMDEGQRPGLSTEALSRELQRSRFKLSTREKMLAATVYMASVTEQRTFEEALLSGKNDGHLQLRCVSEHCRPDETPMPLKVCSLDEVETELGASTVRCLEDLTKTQNDNVPKSICRLVGRSQTLGAVAKLVHVAHTHTYLVSWLDDGGSEEFAVFTRQAGHSN